MLAVISIRKEPAEQSEMISQLLFGECYLVVKEDKDWIKISTCYDKYEGWVNIKQHFQLGEAAYKKIKKGPGSILSAKFADIIRPGFVSLTIGAGSDLPFYEKDKKSIRIKGSLLRVIGHMEKVSVNAREDIMNSARQFLYTPYLWGGRSVFGCDCSGFVQTVFKINQIYLPRDASQQSVYGSEVHSLKESAACDLVFFRNESQSVNHVGILLSPNEIIHCSGYVRIDPIDSVGIYSKKNQSYSHKSLFIKRII